MFLRNKAQNGQEQGRKAFKTALTVQNCNILDFLDDPTSE